MIMKGFEHTDESDSWGTYSRASERRYDGNNEGRPTARRVAGLPDCATTRHEALRYAMDGRRDDGGMVTRGDLWAVHGRRVGGSAWGSKCDLR